MAELRIGKRIVSYDGKNYCTTIDGKRTCSTNLQVLKDKMRLFDSQKGVRKGKSILSKYRK